MVYRLEDELLTACVNQYNEDAGGEEEEPGEELGEEEGEPKEDTDEMEDE